MSTCNSILFYTTEFTLFNKIKGNVEQQYSFNIFNNKKVLDGIDSRMSTSFEECNIISEKIHVC